MSDDITVGDRFEITVEVIAAPDDILDHRFQVRPDGAGGGYQLNLIPAHVLLAGRRLPRVIKVGDRVRTMDSPFITPPKGTIEWTDGADALVRWFPGPGGLVVETVSDLTLIPGDET